MKTPFVSLLLPTTALAAALFLFLSNQPALGQSGSGSSPNQIRQQPMPPDQDAQTTPVAAETTFSGKIVKSAGRLVLTDAVNNTTYQLDNQKKAHAYINKTVKVTGVLDAATGTIHVDTIDPS